MLTLTGCGGGSSGGSGDDNIPVVPNFAGGVATFQDSSVSFQYPGNWILSQDDATLIALIASDQTNSRGGTDRCAYDRARLPNDDLFSLVEVWLESFSDNPEPDVSFVQVNGNEAAHIVGQVDVEVLAGTVTQTVGVETTAQLVYAFPNGHVLMCFGRDSDAAIDFILQSFKVN